MKDFTILKFKPILKSVIWGGRRLSSHLGRKLPANKPFGESWEIVDLPDDQSLISEGIFKNESLGVMRERFRADLLGDAPVLEGRFPLLVKFIDATQTLSVQVHPDEAACEKIGEGARPKTEAWFIIDCAPNGALYVGLKPGVDKNSLEAAIKDGNVETLLNRLPVKPGDFVFLPAGTVHAIGAGVLLAEVQQSSATTYRVFDWNRVGLDGKPRQLHIKEALKAINYTQTEPPKIVTPKSGRAGVSCPFFTMELVERDEENAEFSQTSPLIIMGIKGEGKRLITACEHTAHLELGESLLVPACCAGKVKISSDGPLDCLVVSI